MSSAANAGSARSSILSPPSLIDRAVEPLQAFRTRRMPTRDGIAVVLAVVVVSCLIGAAIPFVDPRLLVVGALACLVVAIVVARPAVAAYLLIGVTPLVAGIDRGTVIPVLRPNEALLGLVGGALCFRAVLLARSGSLERRRPDVTGRSIFFLAVCASVLPLAWMMLRNVRVEQDDILYALLPWKYYAMYLVVRASVKTDREVRLCLWISMWSAALVAFLAILQSLNVGIVTHFLSSYYTSYGYVSAISNGRGGSTLSLPIAVADLMTFNFAIVVGLLHLRLGRRSVLLALGALFLAGVIAGAEFSGVIGLVVAIVIIAMVLPGSRALVGFLPVLGISGLALRPVIESRLSGFQSASGIPVSWSGRWFNLTNYFWPVLFSHGNFILGVRPAARVVAPHRAAGYIWIESGYTWLLWGGGIPLLASFLYFIWVNVRLGMQLIRTRVDSVAVAGLAVVVSLLVVAMLMLFDPHLTYRGSADLLFALLGLAAVGTAREAGDEALAPAQRAT